MFILFQIKHSSIKEYDLEEYQFAGAKNLLLVFAFPFKSPIINRIHKTKGTETKFDFVFRKKVVRSAEPSVIIMHVSSEISKPQRT